MESSTPGRDTAWAMSEENVEIVRRLIAAFNSGGDARLAVEIVEPGAIFEPLRRMSRGRDIEGQPG